MRERWVAGAGLVAIALLMWGPVTLTDGWMYAATGRWIVDHHAVPWTDPFTWTFPGAPWQSNGWLWGLLLYAVWSVGGLPAMAALKPILTVATGLSVRWAARTVGASAPAAVGGMLISTALLFLYIAERPQLASYALYPVVLATTFLALAGGRVRWPWVAATAGVMVLWVNLHSAALGALPLIAALAVGIELQNRPRGVRPLLRALGRAAVPIVAAALATLATPYGTAMWSYSAHVRDLSKATTTEWAHPWQVIGLSGGLELIELAAVAGLCVWLRAWRRLDVFLPVVAAALLTVDAARNAPMLVLTAGSLLPALVPDRAIRRVTGRRDLQRVAAVASLLAALVIAVPRVAATGDPSDDAPVLATAALPGGCRLADDYRLGNWVLWSRPDIPTSVDGRNDVPGLDLTVYRWFDTPGDQAPVLRQFDDSGVTCVLARPDSPLPAALVADGWTKVAADDEAVALVRPSP